MRPVMDQLIIMYKEFFPLMVGKKPWYVQPLIDGVVLFSLYGAS